MLGKISIIVSLGTLCLYLYGVLLIIVNETEENACKMTYMYEYPQFVVSFYIKINFFSIKLATW